jgi:hypothetical protein
MNRSEYPHDKCRFSFHVYAHDKCRFSFHVSTTNLNLQNVDCDFNLEHLQSTRYISRAILTADMQRRSQKCSSSRRCKWCGAAIFLGAGRFALSRALYFALRLQRTVSLHPRANKNRKETSPHVSPPHRRILASARPPAQFRRWTRSPAPLRPLPTPFHLPPLLPPLSWHAPCAKP